MTPAPHILGRCELDAVRFPSSLGEALFAKVMIHDAIEPNLRLPDVVQLDHGGDDLLACFRLARQAWIEGFDRRAMTRLAGKLLRDGDLGDDDRVRFKQVRAKFKHFRNAHALYGAAHRYPTMLGQLTIVMGHVQDAYRNHRRLKVAGQTMLLRLLLTRPVVRRVRAEGNHLALTSAASFRALLETDYAQMAALAARRTVTGHAFHAARKVVGRQVSFWDTLRTIEPTEDRRRVSRWLSAINGSMGSLHDRLVEHRMVDAASYDAEFALPDDIRAAIQAIVRRATAAKPAATGSTGITVGRRDPD